MIEEHDTPPDAVAVAVHLEELARVHLVRGARVARMRRRIGGVQAVLDVRHAPYALPVRTR